jgi:hypothetical protein
MIKMVPVQNARCFVCQEAIFNPICPSCLKKEVIVWLEKTNPSLIKEMEESLSFFRESKQNDVSCILCKRYTDTCPYCFTEYVYNLLKERHPDLVESFLTLFNYDFDHTGYSKDMY